MSPYTAMAIRAICLLGIVAIVVEAKKEPKTDTDK